MTERELLTVGLEQVFPKVCPQIVDNFVKFSDMLLEKNKVMNLTAITDPMEVVTRHFLDCAMLTEDIISEEKVIDIGTGAGFPGLPLAIICSDVNFVLIDSLRKRIDFLNEVIDELGLKNVTAIHARAEEYAAKHRESFSCAVSRAVADLSVLSELTLPLVKLGGKFIAMKAQDCEQEVEKAKKAIEILGGQLPQIKKYKVVQSDIIRSKVEIKKNIANREQISTQICKDKCFTTGWEIKNITLCNKITKGYFLSENMRKYKLYKVFCQICKGK